jgi:soluble lytic murein transglycosylase
MKPIQAVFNQTLRCNYHVAYLLSSLLSVAVTVKSHSEYQHFVDHTEVRLSKELALSAPLVSLPKILSDDDKVTFVADMIKQELPTHPDSNGIARIIVTESRKADIDPLFVAAVVRAESMFRHKAVSHRGAKGLMQLMPQTGQYVAKLSNIALKGLEDLHNPETNIKVGIWYLKHLGERFGGCHEKLLVAYNWGPSNLRRALTNKSSYPRESLQYVQKVLSRHTLWKSELAQYAATRHITAVG